MQTETKIILIVIGLFSIAFIGIPYWIWHYQGNTAVVSSELIEIQGSIESIKKGWVGGKHKNRIIYVKLNNNSLIFRLIGSSYEALNSDITKELKIGDKVTIGTRRNEYYRASNPTTFGRIASSVFDWWEQPRVYELKSERTAFLTISDYNKTKEDFNLNNLFWGFILVLFVAGSLVWETIKEKRNASI